MWIILLEVQYLYLYSSISLLTIKVNDFKVLSLPVFTGQNLLKTAPESKAFRGGFYGIFT
jgi:hypothetical protein